jgi:hypothetical protein
MKLARFASTAALSLLLGSSALMWAQDEHNDAKPPEPRPEATRPAQEEGKPARPEEAKPAQHPEDAKMPHQDEAKPPRQEEGKPGQEAMKPAAKPGERAQAGQRGRIPDEKFRSNFGKQHTFVVNRITVVEGQRRFEYGGYNFNLIDAWPAGWAYTDTVYVDYIDGEYYLIDLAHPGVRIAIEVIL